MEKYPGQLGVSRLSDQRYARSLTCRNLYTNHRIILECQNASIWTFATLYTGLCILMVLPFFHQRKGLRPKHRCTQTHLPFAGAAHHPQHFIRAILDLYGSTWFFRSFRSRSLGFIQHLSSFTDPVFIKPKGKCRKVVVK